MSDPNYPAGTKESDLDDDLRQCDLDKWNQEAQERADDAYDRAKEASLWRDDK